MVYRHSFVSSTNTPRKTWIFEEGCRTTRTKDNVSIVTARNHGVRLRQVLCRKLISSLNFFIAAIRSYVNRTQPRSRHRVIVRIKWRKEGMVQRMFFFETVTMVKGVWSSRCMYNILTRRQDGCWDDSIILIYFVTTSCANCWTVQ